MESIVFLHDILWQIYLCETKCCCWTLSIVFLDMTSFSQISLWQLSIELHSLAPTPSWSTQIYIYFWWWKRPFEIQVLNFYHRDYNEFPSYIQEKDHTVPKRIFLPIFFSITDLDSLSIIFSISSSRLGGYILIPSVEHQTYSFLYYTEPIGYIIRHNFHSNLFLLS